MSIMKSNNGDDGSFASEEEARQQIPAMPVLPRLDRLELLLLHLEEKRNVSCSFSADSLSAKPLSSALEELSSKGNLLERISTLENKVLQLSLESEEGSTSSSCTQPTSANTLQNFLAKTNYATNSEEQQIQDANEVFTDKHPEKVQNARIHSTRTSRHATMVPIKNKRKWLGWLQLGC